MSNNNLILARINNNLFYNEILIVVKKTQSVNHQFSDVIHKLFFVILLLKSNSMHFLSFAVPKVTHH